MKKIAIAFTRARVETAIIDVDVEDAVADRLRVAPADLDFWARYTIAPQIPADAWKPSTAPGAQIVSQPRVRSWKVED
jgi:hypothetical protein